MVYYLTLMVMMKMYLLGLINTLESESHDTAESKDSAAGESNMNLTILVNLNMNLTMQVRKNLI